MKNKGNATIIIIIAILLVVVGLVAWGYLAKGTSNIDLGDLTSKSDSKIEELKKQSTSDEISAIESDLNSTNIERLDEDLDQVNSDLNQL
ncbi:MAG TPA: hypothetical protein VIK81_01305 [Patescibacteria group bacterium]